MLALYNVTFQCGCKNIFRNFLKISFAHKKLKKPPEKVAYLWQLEFFFSAAPTAQNSGQPEISNLDQILKCSKVTTTEFLTFPIKKFVSL